MEEVVKIISEVGFPIVMSLLLLYIMKNNEIRYDETIDSLRKTVEENTLALQALCHALGYDYHKAKTGDNNEEE